MINFKEKKGFICDMDGVIYHGNIVLPGVKDFVECGLCGTAAVISPVGMISDHGKEIYLPSGMEQMGSVTKKLYDTFRGIQLGTAPAPEGWLREIRL